MDHMQGTFREDKKCWVCVRDDGHRDLTAERDALRAQLADAAKVSDGVWEWVPKPKYDALLDKIETARKLADEADCMDCSLGLHILDVLDDVLPLQNGTEQHD
jgi:5-methylcytosine-specific restriction endonuclease McrA